MADTTAPPLFLFAMDQRDSLEQGIYGLKAAPTPTEWARIAHDKLLLFQALLDAVDRLPDGARPGVLVDEEYGAGIAEVAGADAGMQLAMPVEASGQDWFDFNYGHDWRQHAEYFRTDHTKVLVRDNPELDAGKRADQAEKLAELSAWAHQGDHRLILELLVPATDADKAKVDGDTTRYDDEIRPGLTVQSMEYLQDHGVEPTIWKIEGLDARDSAEEVVRTARRGGRDASCIVLGRHAPKDQLDRWLDVAAPVDGFTGFAIGRSNWWEPLQDHVAGKAGETETRKRIADNYVGFVEDYLRAQHA